MKHVQKITIEGLGTNIDGLRTALLSCQQVNSVRICTVRNISTGQTPRKISQRSFMLEIQIKQAHWSLGHAVAQWLRHCATNRKVAGSIADGVTGHFIDIII
jgi:hypothetical protein